MTVVDFSMSGHATVSLATVEVTGTLVDSTGAPIVKGWVTMTLSAPLTDTASPAFAATLQRAFTNGSGVFTFPALVTNDSPPGEPSGTTYAAALYDSYGSLLQSGTVTLLEASGPTIDLIALLAA
jgi:hypothetical protein